MKNKEQKTIKDKSHKFLSEELFSPLIPMSDLTRLNMFDSHFKQRVVLNTPEFPRVFTGFENQGGQNSEGFQRFPKEGFILHKICTKNEYNKLYIFTNKSTKQVYVFFWTSSTRLTENFGYKNLNRIPSLLEGQPIKPNRILSKTTSFDNQMNFCYGVNLKVAFYPWNGLTYEDSLVISKSAAKKFDTTSVDEIKITLNTNDILINIYGGEEEYKCFPDIGEETHNQILAARRRLSYDSLLFDFSAENMQSINYDTDDTFISTGKVTDIEVYCNANIDDLDDKGYNTQLAFYLKENLKFYNAVSTTLQELKDSDYEFLGDSNYWLRFAKDMTSGKKFRDENTDFDNIIIKVKTESVNPLVRGDKLSGRYGNKSVVSIIVDDDEMPILEDGTRADVCTHIFGVLNRVIISQLVEQETNYIANQYMKNVLIKEKDLKKRAELYIDFLAKINKEQADIVQKNLMSLSNTELKEFWKDTFKNGIYINIKPFWNNYNAFSLYELYKKTGTTPRKAKIKIDGEWTDIKTPLVIAEMFYIRLKHDAKCKFSARSGGYLSLSDVPSKNNKNFKENRSVYSKTAVRIGEMEINNLLILKNVEETVRFISMYSSNHEDRERLAMTLLGVQDKLNSSENVFDIKKIEKSDTQNLNKSILDALLYALGMKLVE